MNFPSLALLPGGAGKQEGGSERDEARGAVVAATTRAHSREIRALEGSHILDDLASAAVLRGWRVQSLLLEAITRDAVGDAAGAEYALDRAFDTAERDRVLLPFLVHPVPALCERYSRPGAAHASLLAEAVSVVADAPPASTPPAAASLRDRLTEAEARVLRYLPTNLSKPEIAGELYVSVDTVKTHVKHLYAKLDAHSRQEAVRRARDLGLLPER